MPSRVGTIKSDIKHDINEYNEAVFGSIITAAISRAHREVYGSHWWQTTLKTYEPTSAQTSSQPFLLPSTLKRIKSVRDDDYTYYYDESEGHACIHPYNWYYGMSIAEVLDVGSNCEITAGDTTVTIVDDTFHADVAGEYMSIGALENYYLISTRDSDTTVTLSVAPRIAEDLRGAAWNVRPIGTPTMHIIESDGDEVTSSTLDIIYQEKPLELVSDDNVIALPDDACHAVYIKALQYCMRRKGWSRAARGLDRDYDTALSKAKREQPTASINLNPKTLFRRPRNQTALRNLIDAG